MNVIRIEHPGNNYSRQSVSHLLSYPTSLDLVGKRITHSFIKSPSSKRPKWRKCLTHSRLSTTSCFRSYPTRVILTVFQGTPPDAPRSSGVKPPVLGAPPPPPPAAGAPVQSPGRTLSRHSPQIPARAPRAHIESAGSAAATATEPITDNRYRYR